jgi:catechol 2,3-dioxygenase-like lactoylglutathione lyase family enzyme
MITGIKHIAIAVRDVNAALRKYEVVLGVQGATRHRFERARTDEAHFAIGGGRDPALPVVGPDGAVRPFHRGEG